MKIAITGKMCSGKTTLKNFICEHHPEFKMYSFGQKVKDIAYDLFKMNPSFKDRTLLTSIGQKMREIDENVWINYLINNTKNQEYCIIDDLRYQNEYEALVENGWKIIKINITPELQEERIKQIYPENYQDHLNNRNHLSERNIFEWKENNGPIITINSSDDPEKIKKNSLRIISKFKNN